MGQREAHVGAHGACWRCVNATVDDVAEIARIHVVASQQAERGHIPDACLDAINVETRQRMWQRIVADPKHPVRVIVAEDRGRIVGFAACGPVRGDEERGEPLALYVDPREQRCGRGSALMEAAEDDLRDRGYGVAVVWVLSTNTPATVFLSQQGLAP